MSFLYVGDDGGTMTFETPSLSVAGTVYEIHLERSTGKLFCSCPHAVCRGIVGDLLKPAEGCKHVLEMHRRLALSAPDQGEPTP